MRSNFPDLASRHAASGERLGLSHYLVEPGKTLEGSWLFSFVVAFVCCAVVGIAMQLCM